MAPADICLHRMVGRGFLIAGQRRRQWRPQVLEPATLETIRVCRVNYDDNSVFLNGFTACTQHFRSIELVFCENHNINNTI